MVVKIVRVFMMLGYVTVLHLLKRFKKRFIHRNIPVVVHTANSVWFKVKNVFSSNNFLTYAQICFLSGSSKRVHLHWSLPALCRQHFAAGLRPIHWHDQDERQFIVGTCLWWWRIYHPSPVHNMDYWRIKHHNLHLPLNYLLQKMRHCDEEFLIRNP